MSTYTVKSGDTLSGILKRFGADNWNNSQSWNLITNQLRSKNANMIYPGEVINLSVVPGTQAYQQANAPQQPVQQAAPQQAAPAPQPAANPVTEMLAPIQQLAPAPTEEDFYTKYSREAFQDPFDEWTRNFVDLYMEPEWTTNTYNPAMKQMSDTMNQARDAAAGQHGMMRSRGADRQLGDMAQQFIQAEENMRSDFQSQALGERDRIRTAWAEPLYGKAMTQWMDAPQRMLNMGDLANQMPGIDQNLAESLNQVGNWNPTPGYKPPTRDWSANPAQVGMGTDIFNQYLNY